MNLDKLIRLAGCALLAASLAFLLFIWIVAQTSLESASWLATFIPNWVVALAVGLGILSMLVPPSLGKREN